MIQINKDELKNWIDYKVETTMNNINMGSFIRKLNDGFKKNDTSVISELMSEELFPEFTKDKKEQLIFNHVATSAMGKFLPHNFLHYLIFEYKISEKNSIDAFQVDDGIKAMFQARKLNKELSTELKDGSKPDKKPKV